MNATNMRPDQQLVAGTVIARHHVGYVHVGLLGDSVHGCDRTVLEFSASAGGFCERSLAGFADGRQMYVIGYPGNLAPAEVMNRARMLSERPYSLFQFNCEHFVRIAHGLAPESPQVQAWVLIGLIAASVGLLARR